MQRMITGVFKFAQDAIAYLLQPANNTDAKATDAKSAPPYELLSGITKFVFKGNQHRRVHTATPTPTKEGLRLDLLMESVHGTGTKRERTFFWYDEKNNCLVEKYNHHTKTQPEYFSDELLIKDDIKPENNSRLLRWSFQIRHIKNPYEDVARISFLLKRNDARVYKISNDSKTFALAAVPFDEKHCVVRVYNLEAGLYPPNHTQERPISFYYEDTFQIPGDSSLPKILWTTHGDFIVYSHKNYSRFYKRTENHGFQVVINFSEIIQAIQITPEDRIDYYWLDNHDKKSFDYTICRSSMIYNDVCQNILSALAQTYEQLPTISREVLLIIFNYFPLNGKSTTKVVTQEIDNRLNILNRIFPDKDAKEDPFNIQREKDILNVFKNILLTFPENAEVIKAQLQKTFPGVSFPPVIDRLLNQYDQVLNESFPLLSASLIYEDRQFKFFKPKQTKATITTIETDVTQDPSAGQGNANKRKPATAILVDTDHWRHSLTTGSPAPK